MNKALTMGWHVTGLIRLEHAYITFKEDKDVRYANSMKSVCQQIRKQLTIDWKEWEEYYNKIK